MKWPVKNLDNKKVEELDLPEAIFGQEIRKDILHRVVLWQLAKRRAGTHQTKNVSMVRGTTKKPFRQKGTGRARAGTLRATQYRGGGISHGPQSRDHSYKLPKKVRQLGLKVALSAKAAEGKLHIVDTLKLKEGKTKELVKVLDKNQWQSALFIDGAVVDEQFAFASSNIVGIDILPQQGANVYSILKRDTLVMTKDALHHLEARLK